MSKWLILAVMLSALSFSSSAADFSIKGMGIGGTVEDFRDTFDCSPGKDGLLRCYQSPAKFTVGGEKLKGVLVKFGTDNKVEMITFSFDPDSFSGIRDALTQKYPKIRCEKMEVKTLMGVSLPSESCSGKTVDESIDVRKYGNSVDSGSAIVIKNSVFDRAKSQRQESLSDI